MALAISGARIQRDFTSLTAACLLLAYCASARNIPFTNKPHGQRVETTVDSPLARFFVEDYLPGRPTYNAFIESFNGTLREKCLNLQRFLDLTDAKSKLQAWRGECNESRPRRSFR